MKSLSRAATLLLCASGAQAAHWGVLVAGSNTYGNYRHQADICHAYQVLRNNGVPESNIITMFYDDVAKDPSNPFPGKIYNRPAPNGPGVDVYSGCKKSYTGNAVTAENFLNVLRGNASGIDGGSGEVLKSTEDDEVFINYSDHGGVGLVAMPTGPFLYADQLIDTLRYMHKNKMYKKLVFYLEACESGSMFENLPKNIGIFATTASNPSESSWGDYCPPADVVNGEHLNTCLGDLYSTNWMENSEAKGGMDETLCQQFHIVQNDTTMSHVCKYGDETFSDYTIGVFQGDAEPPTKHEDTTCTNSSAVRGRGALRRRLHRRRQTSLMSARHATMSSLAIRLSKAEPGTPLYTTLAAELAHESRQAAVYKDAFSRMSSLMGHNSLESALSTEVRVTRWDCYRAVQDAVQQSPCGKHTDFTLQYSRVLASMCESANGDHRAIADRAHATCLAAARAYEATF